MQVNDMEGTPPRLAAGVVVGHANPELAGWEGKITPNRNGRLWDLGRYIRVTWHAGAEVTGKGQWITATALTVKGECPDCARPAHYIFAGNEFDRVEGWRHVSPADGRTCWAGKAAFEARRGWRD